MLQAALNRSICLLTLLAFLIQPSWFEEINDVFVHSGETTVSKLQNPGNFLWDETGEETESGDEDDRILLSFPASPEIVSIETDDIDRPQTSFFLPHTVYSLQSRPLWLVNRKLIL